MSDARTRTTVNTATAANASESAPPQEVPRHDPLGPLALLRKSSQGRSLTYAEYMAFRHLGYLRVPYLIPSHYVRRMRSVVEHAIDAAVSPVVTRPDGQVRRISSVLERDPVFLEVLALNVVARPLKSLLGPNVELLLSRHNHATRNCPGDFTYALHRDTLQWSRDYITVLIYLEDATTERGATHVVPGSHLLPFAGTPDMPVRGQVSTWATAHAEYDHVRRQALPVPMPAGGILLIDSLLFHSVGINETPASRLSLTFAVHSVDENRDTVRGAHHLLYGERDGRTTP
jgi:ectoine hydroxylase-related dioxygenase (phytanoyl-CoA dioxygenase family)